MESYHRLSYEDLCQIYALSTRGNSQQSIAVIMEVSQSTVIRKLDRNCSIRGYRFKQALVKVKARRVVRSKLSKMTARLLKPILIIHFLIKGAFCFDYGPKPITDF